MRMGQRVLGHLNRHVFHQLLTPLDLLDGFKESISFRIKFSHIE